MTLMLGRNLTFVYGNEVERRNLLELSTKFLMTFTASLVRRCWVVCLLMTRS